MAPLRVCVYGAGAIGGHLAARLIDAEAAVTSLVVRGAHLAAIRARGLTLRSGAADIVVEPAAATDDPSALPEQDLVVVTLKAPLQAQHGRSVARLLAPGGVALFFANGIPWWWNHGLPGARGVSLPLLDPDGSLWHEPGPERVLGGVVHCTNELAEPGVVLHRGRNRWIVGEPDGSRSPRLDALVKMLARTELGIERASDIRAAVWEKLVYNVAVSGISALTRLQTREASLDPDIRRLEIRLVEETLAVAAATGWDLGQRIDPRAVVSSLETPGVTPSMLQDVLLGRPMEVEAIVGQVHAFADEASVPTPVMDVVLPLLRGLQQGRLMWGPRA